MYQLHRTWQPHLNMDKFDPVYSLLPVRCVSVCLNSEV